MPRTGQPAIRLVGAVQRAAGVLDALAEADNELGTNEIARRTGINASSVSRLRATLVSELERGRRLGYADNFGEREDDLHAIAAPVWGSRSELAAIIGVQGPASRFGAEAMEAAVRPLLDQTLQLSVELGWNGQVEEGAER